MKKLKYVGYSVVMQEVPNEVSLAINISGCPYKCRGCHSQFLWDYVGSYISDDIDDMLNQYSHLVSCVCFMGGDQNAEELIKLINKVKSKGLKACLYTGIDTIDIVDKNLLDILDYIKVGRYVEELGGLNKKTTNQRMYDLNKKKEIFFYK